MRAKLAARSTLSTTAPRGGGWARPERRQGIRSRARASRVRVPHELALEPDELHHLPVELARDAGIPVVPDAREAGGEIDFVHDGSSRGWVGAARTAAGYPEPCPRVTRARRLPRRGPSPVRAPG